MNCICIVIFILLYELHVLDADMDMTLHPSFQFPDALNDLQNFFKFSDDKENSKTQFHLSSRRSNIQWV